MRHTEDPENYEVLAPADTVFDALERFVACQQRGRRLDALVITANASKKHRPSGIITVFDLPALYELVR